MAVIAPLAVITIWWISTHGKGTAPGRLVAWLAAILVVWVMIAMQDPRSADMAANAFASGFGQAIRGLGTFIRLL